MPKQPKTYKINISPLEPTEQWLIECTEEEFQQRLMELGLDND